MEDYKFEPGSIQCCECGWKPEDPWNDSPDDFVKLDIKWYCNDCAEAFEVSEK